VQTIEQQIHHRRGVERQQLRHRETPDDGHAERAAQVGAGAGSDQQGHRSEQRRHRGHDDRPEALETGLVNRLLGRAAAVALRCKREMMRIADGELEKT